MLAGKRQIRVLIVDDSAFMRRAIEKMLVGVEEVVVVGSASTGEEAITKHAELRPDVITMDVEMPGMGGLEAARAIISRRGPPIIMLSSLTRDGAETTLRALEIGVVDFIPKPNSASIDILRVKDDLIEKVRFFGVRGWRAAAFTPSLQRVTQTSVVSPRSSIAPPPAPVAAAAPAPTAVAPPRAVNAPRSTAVPSGVFECVAIGTSTGGPVALANVLPKLPKNFPLPIVIVQHMPAGFTKALAERLDSVSQINVVEGEDGMRLARGTAIIAPAGRQLTLRRAGGAVEIRLEADVKKSLHVPSVDIMAGAVGETFRSAALGVILTGMGHDGVAGLAVIKQHGGYVIGQDEASAVVYGMPRAAAVAGLVDRVCALDDVARVICEVVKTPYVMST